ncbi:MAG: ribosome maturation factor RimP [Flexistipes sinusarabici]|uniref:Ribosome maturation factor RimP n=1 Tax=Flexistipes sinusarabici TaxID=2352 RepID=A0A5D0MJ28_FLESI|nr:ribosome maturation factor RimP [Flexistipes sinusarabici]TYB33734.1 MAG: ribosome maturation factor RimP [Flexistipes sinusarabici]
MNKTHRLIEDKVKGYALGVLPDLGLEIFDVTFRRENTGLVLRVTIDGEGVGLQECSKVSGIISEWLDENDIVGYDNYNLEVSTPGLDRPLRNIDDFVRFRGHYCKVVLKDAEEAGRKTLKGYINNVEDRTVTIFMKSSKQYFHIDFDNIKKANLEVEF